VGTKWEALQALAFYMEDQLQLPMADRGWLTVLNLKHVEQSRFQISLMPENLLVVGCARSITGQDWSLNIERYEKELTE
jgi:hypothetical protein